MLASLMHVGWCSQESQPAIAIEGRLPKERRIKRLHSSRRKLTHAYNECDSKNANPPWSCGKYKNACP